MEIPRYKIQVQTSRSGGPGGQSVNKTETKVELRFHVDTADWLSYEVKDRLKRLFPNKINREGELIVTCSVHRTQSMNLEEAFEILEKLIETASIRPKKRVPTKTTYGAKMRRLDSKKKMGNRKKERNKKDWD